MVKADGSSPTVVAMASTVDDAEPELEVFVATVDHISVSSEVPPPATNAWGHQTAEDAIRFESKPAATALPAVAETAPRPFEDRAPDRWAEVPERSAAEDAAAFDIHIEDDGSLVETSSAIKPAPLVDDLLGVGYQPSSFSSAATSIKSYTLPSAGPTDPLELEAAALEAAAASAAGQANAAATDDEFDSEFDDIVPAHGSVSSALASAVLSLEAAPATAQRAPATATAVAVQQSAAASTAGAPLSSSTGAVSGSDAPKHVAGAAVDALLALQASIAAVTAKEAADAAAAATAAVAAPQPDLQAATTELLQANVQHTALTAVAEDGDEDAEDEDADGDDATTEAADVVAGGAVTAAGIELHADSAGDDGDAADASHEEAGAPTAADTAATMPSDQQVAGSDTDEAALEDAFEQATAAQQQKLAAASTASASAGAAAAADEPPKTTYMAAARHLGDPAETAQHLRSIVSTAPGPHDGGPLSCITRLFASRMPPQCEGERDAVFCVAKQQFVASDPIHVGIMTTLYSSLTGTPISMGVRSWQDIGFQRDADFITDLRGGGMLGPLQALYLLEAYPWLAKQLFNLSVTPMQPFPYIVQQINFTAKALHALRTGQLNRLISRYAAAATSSSTAAPNRTAATAEWPSSASHGMPGPVTAAVNDFYCALTLAFTIRWQAGGASSTINTLGHIVQEVVAAASGQPERAVSELKGADKAVREGRPLAVPAATASAHSPRRGVVTGGAATGPLHGGTALRFADI